MRLHGRQRQLKHGVQHLKHLQQPEDLPSVDSSSPWSALKVVMYCFTFTKQYYFIIYLGAFG